MKYKILFFIHDLMHGGAEKVLVNLVNNMDKNKFDITVQTLFDVGIHKQRLKKDIQYKRIFKKVFRGNSFFLKFISPRILYKNMIKGKYDLVVSYLEGSCTRIVSGCEDQAVKKIAWVHITQSESAFKRCYLSKKEAINVYSRFNKIICVSDDVKRNLSELTRINENIEVKFNTIESDRIKELSKQSVEEIKEDYDKIIICGVGKIIQKKGFMRLARIHKRLVIDGFNHEIIILGVGEEKEKIQAYLVENNLEKTFRFLGYKENPYAYIAKSDLFVCSSTAEGFSTAASEALVVGTPVLTTECAGMKEMLGQNNEFGVVVKNNEEALYQGLKHLLSNDHKLLKYKLLAKERGEMFNTKNTVNEIEKLFEKIILE